LFVTDTSIVTTTITTTHTHTHTYVHHTLTHSHTYTHTHTHTLSHLANAVSTFTLTSNATSYGSHGLRFTVEGGVLYSVKSESVRVWRSVWYDCNVKKFKIKKCTRLR
jgi:hypothetical protein